MMNTDTGRLSRRAGWAGGETIVSQLMAKALGHKDLISLAVGFVDERSLPVEPTRRAMERLWADERLARVALQYGTTFGYGPLREAVLERMVRADGQSPAEAGERIEDVVITAGSNQLLFLLGDVLLDPGDIVLCAAPTYYVFLGALANFGACAVGVESDEQGIVPAAVDAELSRLDAAGDLRRVKAIYLTTYFDNPRAVTIPASRRAELVEIAQRWSRRGRIYLIEDAAYRELRYSGDDVPSLRSFDPDGETVLHIGSFSKSFSPGLRVGWGVLPPAIARAVMAEKGNIDFGSPHFNQVLMSVMLEQGLFDAHVARLREVYRQKARVTLDAVEQQLGSLEGVRWVRPAGGLYVWVELPENIDTGLEGPLFPLALREGVLYVPGEPCYPSAGRAAKRNTLRLCFGVPSEEQLRRGVEALARAVRATLRTDA
jgi:2-aminoadipate transaminase